MIFDPVLQPSIENVIGHFRFEFCVSDEDENGKKMIFGKIEELHECFNVQFVLVKRILEPFFVLIDLLRPFALFFAAKNPATVVFGFDDENAEGRDDEMIDLGGSSFGRMRKIEFVKELVLCGIEIAETAVDHFFTEPAFESG